MHTKCKHLLYRAAQCYLHLSSFVCMCAAHAIAYVAVQHHNSTLAAVSHPSAIYSQVKITQPL